MSAGAVDPRGGGGQKAKKAPGAGGEDGGLRRRVGRRWALAELSLSVPRGVRVMLTGRNGSGKTTLLRVVASLLSPDRGKVHVCGFDVVEDRDALRPQVALLGHHSGHYEA